MRPSSWRQGALGLSLSPGGSIKVSAEVSTVSWQPEKNSIWKGLSRWAGHRRELVKAGTWKRSSFPKHRTQFVWFVCCLFACFSLSLNCHQQTISKEEVHLVWCFGVFSSSNKKGMAEPSSPHHSHRRQMGTMKKSEAKKNHQRTCLGDSQSNQVNNKN